MDSLDTADVAKRTGLTARALRFYEARGLVQPLRTANGRRCYGAGELARLTAIVALKRAGFTLAAIQRLLAGRETDLGRLVAAQIAEVDARAADLADTRALLSTVMSRIDRGEPIDVAILCSLISKGNTTMEHDNWKAISDRYLSDEAKDDFAASLPKMPADFDQTAYSAKWDDLTGRIEAALPMDPKSAQAQAFYAEWIALLAPFTAVASPAMMQGVGKMYDGMHNWQDEQKPPFSAEVWAFIKSAGPARVAQG
ncbi:MerR family transcriptional regulator [Sphingomonas sp. GB1N7]|uniref:MerR family transcriptional regulator n=1 Tax=Parasphingomonas caseinilytica TaxID=3096158 RepID=UPI002FCBA81B